MEGGAKVVEVVALGICRLAGDILIPSAQPQAGGARNFDEPAETINGQAGLDLQLDVGQSGGVLWVRFRTEGDLEAGDGSAAMEIGQGPGQLTAVVGLLIAKIVGAEQFAGGIMQTVGAVCDVIEPEGIEQWVEGSSHKDFQG